MRRIVASVAMVGALGMTIALATTVGADVHNEADCREHVLAEGGTFVSFTTANPKVCTYTKTITGSYWAQTHAAGATDGFVREVFYSQTNTYKFTQDSNVFSGPTLVSTGSQTITGLGDCLNPAGIKMPTGLVPNLPVCSLS